MVCSNICVFIYFQCVWGIRELRDAEVGQDDIKEWGVHPDASCVVSLSVLMLLVSAWPG